MYGNYFEAPSFFLEINPDTEIGEILTLFCRSFQNVISNSLIFIDANGDGIDITIQKGNRTAMIVRGYKQLLERYRLNHGGWLKVKYVGRDKFLIDQAFDHNMHVVSNYIVPLKSLLDKNNYNFNDINLPASEHISPLCDVGPYVPSYNQPFFFPNPSPDIFMKSFLYPNNGNGLFMSSTVCKELPITVQSDMSDLDIAVANQVWRIKVRVIKIWFINLGEEKFRRPNLEMVVMDELGDRIQCSVRNPLRRLFEQELVEGNVYSVANFSIELNDQKYKPTNHTLRVFFKRESQIRVLVDINFPNNIFHFVPNEMILNHDNPQSHLIDVIGLLTGKGDIIEFCKNGKKSIYMVIELDDMQSKGKIRCTLWEEFATQLVKHMEQYPNTEFIIIVQFAKFNLFKGIHEPWAYLIQTTTLLYTLTLILKKLRNLDKVSGTKGARCVFIHLKKMRIHIIAMNVIFILILMFLGNIFVLIQFHCFRLILSTRYHANIFCIQMRVSDETDSASFIVYDKEASKFLEISTSELRLRQISKGCSKDEFPVEINSFRGKKFLFKISVKLDDINAFQPCKITVLKLTEDPNLLTSFSSKYKTFDNTPIENTELQSLQTDSTDNSKEISSQSCEIISLDGNDDFRYDSGVTAKNLLDIFPDNATTSSSKCRKLSKESDCSFVKEHILPEIPSIFYRKYKDQLNQRMFFIDLNQNQVEVMIGKGHSCAYILAGFDTLVKFYELKEGGWMKVMFIGEDLFLITKSLHPLPSLFYRKFKDLLGNTIVTFDANHNLIELRIEKLNHTAYIIRGLHKLMNFYGLYRGGYIKLSYAYKEYFRIIKIRDHNMNLVTFVYTGLLMNLDNINYFKERTILAPTLEVVHEVNNTIMEFINSDEKEFFL
ncbi:hypothetical protein Ahy_A07g035871 [Arachis hypogaea]|uniref:Replication protein A 70 kDa DNA-binding subunit B/D first OB fold domain-containing protein n=1 Tax=Arachis hypogaea TaxID=3818 RepID=A0A445CEL3_ARAHY|nr:hypothetical protein Ahy_A07g035871 [Arachis hypogaea]